MSHSFSAITDAIVQDIPSKWDQYIEKGNQYISDATQFVVFRMIAEHPNEFVTACASVAIALFTFVLARSTKKLWTETKGAVALARDEFISTHRPHIIVRFFGVDPTFLPNHPIRAWYMVVNTGQTDATINLVGCDIGLRRGRQWEIPGIDAAGKAIPEATTIKSGEQLLYNCQSRWMLKESAIGEIAAEKLHICVIGEITYSDDRFVKRRTAFHRIYNPKTESFTASQDQEDEYHD